MLREMDDTTLSVLTRGGEEELSIVVKAIAKELGISPRTVSTHVSNTFQKLEIGSRGELADYARAHSLLSGEAKV